MRKYSSYWLHVHDKAVIRKNNNCNAHVHYILPLIHSLWQMWVWLNVLHFVLFVLTIFLIFTVYSVQFKSPFLHTAMQSVHIFCAKLKAIINLCNGLRIYHLLIKNLDCTFISLIEQIIIKCFKPQRKFLK